MFDHLTLPNVEGMMWVASVNFTARDKQENVQKTGEVLMQYVPAEEEGVEYEHYLMMLCVGTTAKEIEDNRTAVSAGMNAARGMKANADSHTTRSQLVLTSLFILACRTHPFGSLLRQRRMTAPVAIPQARRNAATEAKPAATIIQR